MALLHSDHIVYSSRVTRRASTEFSSEAKLTGNRLRQ